MTSNAITFTRISRSKKGVFACFKLKASRKGVAYTATIQVDLVAAELDLASPLEEIIEKSALLAVDELKRTEVHFEGLIQI